MLAFAPSVLGEDPAPWPGYRPNRHNQRFTTKSW